MQIWWTKIVRDSAKEKAQLMGRESEKEKAKVYSALETDQLRDGKDWTYLSAGKTRLRERTYDIYDTVVGLGFGFWRRRENERTKEKREGERQLGQWIIVKHANCYFQGPRMVSSFAIHSRFLFFLCPYSSVTLLVFSKYCLSPPSLPLSQSVGGSMVDVHMKETDIL